MHKYISELTFSPPLPSFSPPFYLPFLYFILFFIALYSILIDSLGWVPTARLGSDPVCCPTTSTTTTTKNSDQNRHRSHHPQVDQSLRNEQHWAKEKKDEFCIPVVEKLNTYIRFVYPLWSRPVLRIWIPLFSDPDPGATFCLLENGSFLVPKLISKTEFFKGLL